MITCYVRYVIDPYKLSDFERYAKLWIPIVDRMGGQHHGYFLPQEGANNVALALFSFQSLADYEIYRKHMANDTECNEAYQDAETSKCIVSYERTFMKPIF